MVSEVIEVEIDRASRVLVPRKLRDHASIKEDAVLVGMYDRIELWGHDIWHTHLSQLEDEHEMALGKVLQLPNIKPPFPGAPSPL
jgi:division/cell wall cluster transcriptional repressor MraZ